MNENGRQVLEMLATGKITADEAERLLAALEKDQAARSPIDGSEPRGKPSPRYMRVLVEDSKTSENPTKVNIRVPMQLLRAGVRLAGLIPAQARNKVNDALRENGLSVDLNQIKPENLEEIVDQLADLTVDVDDKDSKVRVFCE
jgi:hypothetical protein